MLPYERGKLMEIKFSVNIKFFFCAVVAVIGSFSSICPLRILSFDLVPEAKTSKKRK
jgi:hypothetical protein